MTRRTNAIAVFVVMLFVVAACSVSFAEAADAAVDPCGPGKSWALAKLDGASSIKPLLSASAIPVPFVDVFSPASRWAGAEDAAQAPSHIVVVQPRAPRAPPLV